MDEIKHSYQLPTLSENQLDSQFYLRKQNKIKDDALIAAAIEKARLAGYTSVFTSRPKAWFANGIHHYRAKIVGRDSWVNSRGNEVIIFLLTGFGCSGYCIQEMFDP